MGRGGRNQQVGKVGEAVAAAWLQARGDRIVGRNVRTPYGEIDLIVRRGERWVFVEVKTRTSSAFGWPEEAVDAAKWAHLTDAALYWLYEEEGLQDPDWQVDIIAVRLPPDLNPRRAAIRWYENITPP